MYHFFNLNIVIKGILNLMLALCFSLQLFSQVDLDEKIDKDIEKYYNENVANKIDTSYVDFEVEDWSLRLYTLFKDHSFQINNPNIKLKYTPNNRFGVGFGAAYYPFILDIGFNISGFTENPTKRFDLQGQVFLDKNFIGFAFQSYKGFNVSSSVRDRNTFREDIQSSAISLNYAYIFNTKRISFGSVFSGSQMQKKSAGSFVLGGFFNFNNIKADSTIVPEEDESLLNELSGMNGSRSIGGGISGGYSHIFVFKHHLYLFLNALPGIGLLKKEISTDSGSYQPSDPWLYRLNLGLTTGYNGPKFYFILTGGFDLSSTSLDFGNQGVFNTGKAKLIFGYKFNKHSKKTSAK